MGNTEQQFNEDELIHELVKLNEGLKPHGFYFEHKNGNTCLYSISLGHLFGPALSINRGRNDPPKRTIKKCVEIYQELTCPSSKLSTSLKGYNTLHNLNFVLY